jgi:hypothetical protein
MSNWGSVIFGLEVSSKGESKTPVSLSLAPSKLHTVCNCNQTGITNLNPEKYILSKMCSDVIIYVFCRSILAFYGSHNIFFLFSAMSVHSLAVSCPATAHNQLIWEDPEDPGRILFEIQVGRGPVRAGSWFLVGLILRSRQVGLFL